MASTFDELIKVNAGVQFPATQAPSSNVNTLDDYEEGSWTPVIGGASGTSGQSYTAQEGQYVKIGSLVMCGFTALLSTEGTITGNVQIQGLPFSPGGGNTIYAVQLGWISLATNWVNIVMQIPAGATYGAVVGAQAAAAANNTPLTATDINSTSQFFGMFGFRT